MRRYIGALLPLLALSGFGISARNQFALGSLTVPAEQLPAGCSLQSPIATRQVRMPNVPKFSTNPWQGTGYRELLDLQGSVGGGMKLPDGPPPSSRELAAMQERLLENVVEGYRAEYFNERGYAAVVVAVRYKEGTPLPGNTLNRFVFGSTVAALRVAAKNDCSIAVEAHLRTLK